MKLYSSELSINGSFLQGENPQPRFRAKEANMHCAEDGTLRSEEHIGYGVACKERTLPYRMQDRYKRGEETVCLKTIVMENEYLKAVFMPQLGGKLWSLYSKDENRELLYTNPVMRPANLANRNAWTAGGIEWNLGHTGHSAFTCDNLHCVMVKADNGEEFLRMYEYEATHAQILQMDFHLPSGSHTLGMYVNIKNARGVDTPLYWWTNIAAKLTEHTRVFSGTPEIIYQLTSDPAKNMPGFAHCQMPQQPNLKGVDLSYPWQIPHSLEYFFQNERTQCAPWEVSIEKDCTGLFERSTQPLFARKMFCWGNSVGGRHWCDYLSKEGCGDYIEIQSGLAPTQLHTSVLPANGNVSFTQIFGAFTAPDKAQTEEWNVALPFVAERVEQTLSAAEVNRLHVQYSMQSTLPQTEVLHLGGAYGGLEEARRQKACEMPLSAHLKFPLPLKNSPYYPWLQVLAEEPLQESAEPLPFITDIEWEKYLKTAAAKGDWKMQYHYAVLLAENGEQAQAEEILTKLCNAENPWAAHALGVLAKRDKNAEKAEKYFAIAYALEGGKLDASFAEEAMGAELSTANYDKAWEIYNNIPEDKRTETETLLCAEAALKLDKFSFLEKAFTGDYASIREGAVGLSELWYEYRARVAAKEKNIEYSPKQIDRTITLPNELNFLMFQDMD
ncbi:MAG: DUF5107 domain-containing protein [Oscillospiraceae bacterium]